MESYWRAVMVVGATLCLCGAGEGGAAAGSSVRLWEGAGCGRRLRYALESGVLLNEAARRDQEAGWRLQGSLTITATAYCAQTQEALLRFELPELSAQARGAGRTAEWVPRPSEWEQPARRAAALAHWHAGVLVAVYLPADDPPAFANYKRAVISLFQFQILDGERNETDASGACAVRYETLGPLEFRKIKSGCEWEGGSDAAGAGGDVTSRRVTRYTLRPDLLAVSGVFAEEGVWAGEGAGAGGKARAWARLLLQGDEGTGGGGERGDGDCLADAPGLPGATAQIPDGLRRHTSLQLDHTPEPEESIDEDPPLSAEEAIRTLVESGAGEGPGEGGSAADAATLLRVYPALRAASASALQAALQPLADVTALTVAARALGGAGTAAAFEAAAGALQLRREPLQPAAGAFLAAFAVAPQPDQQAIAAVLALSSESRCARVRGAALLSAAAAAHAAHTAHTAAAAAVRDHVAKQLARCKDEPCRVLHITALGNLRRADTVELLLEQLALGPGVAGAAVRALAGAPDGALLAPRVRRLLALATNHTYPFDVRAAALDLAVCRSADMPGGLAAVARRLHAERGPAAHELRRVLWQRLAALGDRYPRARDLLRALERDKELGSWHARAHAGTSSVLWRETGWALGAHRAALDSAQLALGSLLRRGVVALHAVGTGAGAGNRTAAGGPLVQLELWTRGMAALAGTGTGAAAAAGGEQGADDGGDEDSAAGLSLSVGGAALPPLTLFESQSELLGHVWAGRGSEPTPVLRALVPLAERAYTVPTLGGAWTRVRTAGGAAVAIDAHASVSLWSRTAAARLSLRAAAAARTRISLATPYAAAAVSITGRAAVQLHIAADLDFYDAVALCVRAHTPAHLLERNATLLSVTGARKWTVRRTRATTLPRAARTLALGRHNDRACRTLAAAADTDTH